MKKTIRTYWQLLIFPVLCYPYFLLNKEVIVKWLGCGCPATDEQGNTVANHFNANDFTFVFWGAVALIVIVISLFTMRNFTKWQYKLLYITLIAAGSIFVAVNFFYSMRWR